MSRLIYEGNTVERFGKTIPTPFIEKIKIYENEIEADISIYLHITDDDTINQSIYDDLSNLRLYAGFGIINQQPDRLSLGTNFILVNDNIYNNEGKRFAKLTFSRNSSTRELPDFPISRAISDSSNRETYYSCFIAISNDEDGAINRDLHSLNQPSEFDRQGIYGVLRNISSPLVYEKIFTAPRTGRAPEEGGMANRLATDPITIYTDISNVPYESIPLKSIQKNYHKTTDSFRQQIKTQLDALVNNFSNTSDQQVQSFRDSISFMTQTKNESADFLTTLDSVRNSFPSRTSTSELGLLYNAFKNIIFAANDALILEEKVTRQIVPNTKLIDLRGIQAAIAVPDAPDWERRNSNTYEPRVDDTGNILYPNVFMERQQLEVPKTMDLNGEPVTYSDGTLIEPDFDITSIFGYFFFDYEKALHKKSNISQIFEVQKLLNIWGNDLFDSFFSLKRTEMLRFLRTRLGRKVTTVYDNNRPLTNVVLNKTLHEDITKVVQKAVDATEAVRETTDIPYVMIRGFDTVEGLDGYRLLAFEFQDFEEASSSFRAGGSYRFNVFLNDNTLDFYDELVKNYEEILSEIKDYESKAQDFCSFNNIDNRFNDFFVNGIKEQYTDPENYPWMKAPKLFAMHLDLINNLFFGSATRMSEYASNTSAIISPENGTLLALQNFVSNVDEFYEKYYGIEGEITKLISSRRDPQGNLSPSLKDNTEFIATLGYDDFPDVVDFTVDIEPPAKLKLWNGSEVLLTKEQAKTSISTIAGTMAMARSQKKSVSEFIEKEGGSVPIEAVNAIFEPGILRAILGIGSATAGASSAAGGAILGAVMGGAGGAGVAAAGAALLVGGAVLGVVALTAIILAMIFSVSKRTRTREVVKFINKFISRIQDQATELTRDGKKALIERELRFAFGKSDDRPKPYKRLEKKDIKFLEDEKAKIGNIGLYTIACEVNNIYDVSNWFENSTENIRD